MPILFLIGLRGSGKSHAAQVMGKRFRWRVCDTDALVVCAAGADISHIVAQEGWESFRAREKAALAEAVAGAGGETPCVVATGGGIVLDPENRAFMRRSGTVVYLDVPVEALVARLERSRNVSSRPPLTGMAPGDEVRAVRAERDPLYRAAAHHVVDASLPLEVVARRLYDIVINKDHS